MSISPNEHPKSRAAGVLKSKAFLGSVAVIVIYSLMGFFLAPYLVKRQLTQFVTDGLHRQLAVEEVRINPYSLRMAIEGVDVKEGNGDPLLKFGRLAVDFELSSLWEWAWTFSEISLEQPELTLAIDERGEANLKRLADDLPAGNEPTPAKTDADPVRILTHRLRIRGGILHVVDNAGQTPAVATITPLDLEMKDLTTIPQREGAHQLIARLPGGGNLEWKGEASLSPVHSQGRIRINGLKPANAWAFFQDRLIIEEPSGSLDLETSYRIALEQGGLQLTLNGLSGNLSELALTPRGANEPVLSMDSFALQGGSFDLAERRLRFSAVTLAGGQILTQFDQHGDLNWNALFAPAEPASASPPAATPQPEDPPGSEQPWHLELEKFTVTDLAVLGADLSRRVPVDISLGAVDLSMQLISEVTLDNVQTLVEGFTATLSDILISEREQRKQLATLAEVKLEGGAFNLNDRRIGVNEISFRGGTLAFRRDRDGQINWVQQALDRGVARSEVREAHASATAQGRPWSVAVNKLRLRDTSASFTDPALASSEVLGLSSITLDLTEISLDPQRPIGFDLALEIRQGGTVLAKGTSQPFQPQLEGSLELKQLNLPAAQPFVETLAHMKIESGTLSGGGKVRYGVEQSGSLQFSGNLDITQLKVIEPHTGKTLIGWAELATKRLQAGLAPDGIALEQIVLNQPEGTFVIDENKTTNWQYVLKDQSGSPPRDTSPPAAPAGAQTAPMNPTSETAFPVSIAQIRVEKGNLNFADLSLTPQFATHIHELSGTIAGLSTAPGTTASIELEGRVDEYGQAKIRGELQPSNPAAMTDIQMAFQNVEMTHLTPYAIKFAGHEVTSGKLSVDLGYKIDQHQLSGDNQIIVQQLELGEKVDSPDALDLPLELGLALLKDPNGKIDINLPVQGDMSHPQFSFGQLIGQAMVNFFAKLVTAPFQILGGLLGADAQDLDQIVFEPGRSDLSPPEQEKLTLIAKALRERPQLAVSIEGTYDRHRDAGVLKERKIRREVAEARGDGGEPGVQPGPVSYNDPKSQRALEQVFSKLVSPAALTQLKKRFAATEAAPATTKDRKPAKRVPANAGELYKAIYEELVNIAEITHNELRSLGQARAKSVQGELTGTDGIPPQRVSLSKPAKAEHSSAKASGVITRLGSSRGQIGSPGNRTCLPNDDPK